MCVALCLCLSRGEDAARLCPVPATQATGQLRIRTQRKRSPGPCSQPRLETEEAKSNERTNKLACKSHGFWILLSSVQKDRNNLYWYLSTSSQDPTPVFKKKKKERKRRASGTPREPGLSRLGLVWTQGGSDFRHRRRLNAVVFDWLPRRGWRAGSTGFRLAAPQQETLAPCRRGSPLHRGPR